MKRLLLSLCLMQSILSFAQSNDTLGGRKALIIGISEYSMPDTDTLHGVPYDLESARRIALSMGIKDENITFIKDSQATKANIISAIQKTGDMTTDGSRIFVYFTGHGTRYADEKTGNCVDGLLSYDGYAITNAEFAAAAQKLTRNADKVVTMIDACFSEGVIPGKNKTRSMEATYFKPKFSAKSGAEVCKPVNLSRGLLPEVTRLGGIQENFVQITSSRPDEVSYDDEKSGGIATQSIRDCLLGEAKDRNASGAVSIEEVQQCAQEKVDQKLQSNKITQHLTVSGNRNLIPVLMPETVKPALNTPQVNPVEIAQNNFSSVQTTSPVVMPPTQVVQTPSTSTTLPAKPPEVSTVAPVYAPAPVQGSVSATIAPPTQPIVANTPAAPIAGSATNKPIQTTLPPVAPEVASLATLKDIEQQRNPRKLITVKLNKPLLKIGKDLLDLSITSQSNGYIYLVLLGSDAKSFYLLYPNGLDKDNFIKAGQTVRVPKPNWGIQSAGPVGVDHLLVMVSDSPRQLNNLTLAEPTEQAPYTFALNDLGGRQALINYLTASNINGRSESFAAQLLTVKEIK